MADQLEFRSKLAGLLAVAVENDNKMTCEEVDAYFQADQLSHGQMELVYDYLLAQKVAVKGYVKQANSAGAESVGVGMDSQSSASGAEYSLEEEAYLAEYELDLQAIRGAKPGEIAQLYTLAKSGDAQAKARITEIYLPLILEIGKSMHREELFLGDIIQEGNVSLMLALETMPQDLDTNLENALSEYIETEVREGIQMLIEETLELSSRDKQMVQKVSDLDETITKLTDDLGRKITIDEIALYMEIPEDEIMEILKLTGEEVEEVDDDNATGITVDDLGIQVLDK